MTSNQPRGASQPGSPAGSLRLVLELSQDDETASGSVGPADGSEPIRFNGWIGLMSAVNILRAQAGRTQPTQAGHTQPPTQDGGTQPTQDGAARDR